MISECLIYTGQCCDLGKSVLVEAPDSPTSVAYIDIMQSEWNYIIDLNYLFLFRDFVSLWRYSTTFLTLYRREITTEI